MNLNSLFPSWVCWASVEVSGTIRIRADEESMVAGAADRRRWTFAAGRFCAHRALQMLGVDGGPVLRAGSGAPIWPPDVVGSISHTNQWAVAAVAFKKNLVSLGLDIEKTASGKDEMAPHILTRREQSEWSALPAGERSSALVLRFSAKESVIKCLETFSVIRPTLHEMEIRMDPESGRFHCRENKGWGEAELRMQGFYRVDEATGHVVTATLAL